MTRVNATLDVGAARQLAQQVLAKRSQWIREAQAADLPSIEDRPASAVREWIVDLEGELERFADRATGTDPGDPREALVQLVAVASICIESMGETT